MRNIIIITIIIIITVIFSPAAFAQSATLSLSPSSVTFNKGCNFTLDIALNTGGAQTDGTDSILVYDTARFSAVSISNGTIYPEYPGNNIDDVAGKITISGLASVQSAFSGSGTLASINFRVKDQAVEGASQIKFDFDPNNKSETTDSNVVERGTVVDILNSVVNGSYTVGSGVCAGAKATPKPGAGAPGISTPSGAVTTPTIDNLVDKEGRSTGSEELTFAIAIVGSVFVVLGILGLALL